MDQSDYLDWEWYSEEDCTPLLQEGEGSFTIMQCLPKLSKKNYKMLELKLDTIDEDGVMLPLYDYLVWTHDDEAGKKRFNTKLRNIAKAINKVHITEKGHRLHPKDFVGERGKVMIKTQEASGNFPAKSVPAKYIDRTTPAVQDYSAALGDEPLPPFV